MFETLRGPISLLVCFHFDDVKLFNMFISSVKTGILCSNAWDIEGTYFTMFLFWQLWNYFNMFSWTVKTGNLSLNVWNIRGDLFHFWHIFILTMWYYHFKCKNRYFRFKWFKYRGDIFHFWHVLNLTIWNYQ